MITEATMKAEDFPRELRRLQKFANKVGETLLDDGPENKKWSIVDDMICDLYDDIIDPLAEILRDERIARRDAYISDNQ